MSHTTTTRQTPSVGRQILAALGMLAGVVFAAGIGVMFNAGNIEGWYADVEKVPWNPPNWLFGPAWSLLYLLIAIAGFLIWRRGFRGAGERNAARPLLTLFIVQLALNAMWSPLFFAGFPAIGYIGWLAALMVIVALDIVVAILILRAWRDHRAAAVLLLPYLAWILFATTLNAGILFLNV